ncbi:acyl-CoA dehydrogenase family protein [Streptomyces cylindrosporus]|uniref:Acyl-CoA dehydrogenase n=1 Tax=Streptomyces cylindrosporus TaxID=2927583 RepID=A0ABS9YAV6_9ACTN|nr:acyl-CoA dehydrogenase family protein [Streptomyces cylindrosporus]MCI3274347.1 acyl-CoA dehydrogenase [Streptomyces cylindrosporus]
MDPAEVELLTETLRKTMTTVASGPALDTALLELGWRELLAEYPEVAVPTVFRLLGETGAHASVLTDVVGAVPLPYAGGRWVEWGQGATAPGAGLDEELPLRLLPAGRPVPVAAGRRAVGWWLLGTGRAMLTLARGHALDRVQFGRPLASFQAVRHRLAETLVALEGAEAVLAVAEDGLGSLLAKAAAGQAALTAARHCQQVLGGIGFTAEHPLHRHVRRAVVLDGLLGSARELTREAGALLRAEGAAPRLVQL